MRDKILAEKASALQAELEAWAMEQNVLKVGERLLFSLRIGKAVLVAREEAQQLLEMEPVKFFSIKRLTDVGAPHSLASRASRAIKFESIMESPDKHIHTMREWLEVYDSESIKRIPNLGKKSLEWMIRLIHESGLQLHEA